MYICNMHKCAHFDDDFGDNDVFSRWTFRHFGSKEPKRDIESGIKIAWSENGSEFLMSKKTKALDAQRSDN